MSSMKSGAANPCNATCVLQCMFHITLVAVLTILWRVAYFLPFETAGGLKHVAGAYHTFPPGAINRTADSRASTTCELLRVCSLARYASGPAKALPFGEQQALAVARALMTRGRIMLLDEPSVGLSPILVQEIFRVIVEINEAGTTILLVEQNANMALKVAHHGYVLQTGEIAMAGPAVELANDPRVREPYLGG